jgi:VCBS repeat protein
MDPNLTQSEREIDRGGIVIPPLDNLPPLEPACRTISDAAELARVLRNDEYRGVICIPDWAVMDLSYQHNLPLRDGVTLLGTRSGVLEGALLYTTDMREDYALFEVRGQNVRIQGLRLIGPSTSYERNPKVGGIHIITAEWGRPAARGVVVEGNELAAWPEAAVAVRGDIEIDRPEDVPDSAPRMSWFTSRDVLITNNYFHDSVRDGSGYGVVVDSGAYATIEGNVFDDHRHAVASNGKAYTGYIARWNYILEGGHCEEGEYIGCYWNQHFDVHGRAEGYHGGPGGEYFLIEKNTIRGEQTYYITKTRPAFWLRGTPSIGAYFWNNVLVHDDRDAAIRTEDGVTHLYETGNHYNTDPWLDWAVGDFDGDGRDDVFLATGTAWYYSSAGQTEWRFLKESTAYVPQLGFGHFDDDNTTDVFEQDGGNWYYSPGGKGERVLLGSSSIPITEYRFGDFNGDGKTDVFRADGTRWWVSWSGRSPWTQLNASGYRVANLRFGDFDGDGATDVFAIANGWWSWSRSGQSAWMKLNDQLATDLSSLQFGDFDGDRVTDIAQRSGSIWRMSPGGRYAWRQLRPAAATNLDTPTLGLVGDFNGDNTDDILRPDFIPIIAGALGRQFTMWSRPLGDAFQVRSRHYMK